MLVPMSAKTVEMTLQGSVMAVTDTTLVELLQLPFRVAHVSNPLVAMRTYTSSLLNPGSYWFTNLSFVEAYAADRARLGPRDTPIRVLDPSSPFNSIWQLLETVSLLQSPAAKRVGTYRWNGSLVASATEMGHVVGTDGLVTGQPTEAASVPDGNTVVPDTIAALMDLDYYGIKTFMWGHMAYALGQGYFATRVKDSVTEKGDVAQSAVRGAIKLGLPHALCRLAYFKLLLMPAVELLRLPRFKEIISIAATKEELENLDIWIKAVESIRYPGFMELAARALLPRKISSHRSTDVMGYPLPQSVMAAVGFGGDGPAQMTDIAHALYRWVSDRARSIYVLMMQLSALGEDLGGIQASWGAVTPAAPLHLYTHGGPLANPIYSTSAEMDRTATLDELLASPILSVAHHSTWFGAELITTREGAAVGLTEEGVGERRLRVRVSNYAVDPADLMRRIRLRQVGSEEGWRGERDAAFFDATEANLAARLGTTVAQVRADLALLPNFALTNTVMAVRDNGGYRVNARRMYLSAASRDAEYYDDLVLPYLHVTRVWDMLTHAAMAWVPMGRWCRDPDTLRDVASAPPSVDLYKKVDPTAAIE